MTGLDPNSSYCWRVRYRDEHLKWSDWSTPIAFTTGDTELTANLVINPGGENDEANWTIETGIIESLGPGECNGVNPYSGNKYFAVGGLCDGNETSYSEVYQEINVSSYASDIDGGLVEAIFGGYLSNYNGNDQPTMQLEFLDDADQVLGSTVVLTTLSSSWVYLEATETVPANTRKVKTILTGTRNAGTDNDSYFDDLLVKLDLVPGTNCTDPPLPVELVSFSGECIDNHAFLQWEVEAEEDIHHYQIERSIDGQQWLIVGSEKPTSIQSPRKIYTHTSWEFLNNLEVYYRLKIVDLDGAFQYAPVIRVSCIDTQPVFTIYPNPVDSGSFTLTLDNPGYSPVVIHITNVLGKTVFKKELTIAQGIHDWTIDTANWPKGWYTASLHTRDWLTSEKLVIE